MPLTQRELEDMMAHRFDLMTLCEELKITEEDIIERFRDRIEDDFERLETLIDWE